MQVSPGYRGTANPRQHWPHRAPTSIPVSPQGLPQLQGSELLPQWSDYLHALSWESGIINYSGDICFISGAAFQGTNVRPWEATSRHGWILLKLCRLNKTENLRKN